MKKLILFLVFAVAAFAQHGGHASMGGHSAPSGHFNAPATQHFSAPATQHFSGPVTAHGSWSRFGTPGGYRPVAPVRPPVVFVRPGFGGYYGGFGWNYYFGLGFWPYYYPYNLYGPYGVITAQANQALPCKKESLRDSNGTKHDILLCVQPDGSMKVVADANTMIAVPKDEVKQ